MGENVQGTVLSGQSSGGAGTVLSGQSSSGAGTVLSGQSSSGAGTVLSGQSSSGVGTVLSGQSSGGAGTVLSGQSSSGVGTVLGGLSAAQAEEAKNWDPELLLRPGNTVEGYTIVGFVSRSGEAQLYKAVRDGQEYVVKIYLYEQSLKDEVVEKLVGKQFKNLAFMIASGDTRIEIRPGEYIEKAYEISPFYEVVKKPLTYIQLRRLIEQVNEGLHELHEMNIFHKDIKPANIMRDSNRTYRIIDFGISSVAAKGQTSLNNTTTGLSFDYASPDTRATAKAGPEEDYYSFGITIYEFFTGELPYAELGVANNRYEQLNSIGIKVRESQHMPEELVKLIHGLTFYSNNPELKKKRWGYEEVREWLDDPSEMEDLDMETMSGMANGAVMNTRFNNGASTVYRKGISFRSLLFKDSFALADALGSRWEEGKKFAGRGLLEDFFKELGSEYAYFRSVCEDARTEAEDAKTDMDEDKAFWKLLYLLEPKLKKFYWNVSKEDGDSSYSCEELGVYFFLQPMQQRQDDRIPKVTRELLESGLLPKYLGEQLEDKDKYHKATELIKEYNTQEREKAVWKLGYLLTGKALFRYRNKTFETKDALYQYLIEWTNSLGREEALAVVRAFENTKEFQAWLEYQKG